MNCLTTIDFLKKSIVILTVGSLSACSFIYGEDGLIKDTTFDYANAKQEKEIVIPDNLSQKDKVDYAVVPEIGESARGSIIGRDLQNNAPVQILDVIDNVRVDKQAVNPAIFVQDDVDFIWASIVDFLAEKSITPNVLDQSSLMIDTGWVAIDERGLWLGIEGAEKVDEFRAKYLITLQPNQLNGEAHLEVNRVIAQKINDDTDTWEEVISSWEDSAQMLNMLIFNYDKKYTENQIAKKANAIAGFNIELASDNDNNAAFITHEDKEVVWDVLPKILTSASFEVVDRDRRSMTYFIEYKENEPGFFASLFSEKEETVPLDYGNYQVALSSVGELTAMTFNDAQGNPLDSAVVVKMYPVLSKFFVKK